MFPVLLRLLLCLCLLVDTVAPAVAGTHLALAVAGEDDARVMADGADHAAASDCHGTEDASVTPPGTPDPQDEDCLQRCLDLCVQHGFAAFTATVAPPAIVPAREPVRVARVSLHDAPAFPPLRPPIA